MLPRNHAQIPKSPKKAHSMGSPFHLVIDWLMTHPFFLVRYRYYF